MLDLIDLVEHNQERFVQAAQSFIHLPGGVDQLEPSIQNKQGQVGILKFVRPGATRLVPQELVQNLKIDNGENRGRSACLLTRDGSDQRFLSRTSRTHHSNPSPRRGLNSLPLASHHL